MSVDTSNDIFRKNMLDEIKKIQNELIELKNIKKNITKPKLERLHLKRK